MSVPIVPFFFLFFFPFFFDRPPRFLYVLALNSPFSGTGASSTLSRQTASGARSGAGGKGDLLSCLELSPFLLSASIFCALRMCAVAVELSVTDVYTNMQTGFALECFGNIMFLLTFTIVAVSWCNMIIRADIAKEHVVRFKYVLLIGWGAISVGLLVAMMVFMIMLPHNFGAGVHDGFVLNTTTMTALAAPPGYLLGRPNTMIKPQASIITQAWTQHNAFMAEKGLYSCYGFLLGLTFSVLATIIIVKMLRASSALGGETSSKFRRTVFSILFVAIPVTGCFAIIFIMNAIETTTHRHGDRDQILHHAVLVLGDHCAHGAYDPLLARWLASVFA